MNLLKNQFKIDEKFFSTFHFLLKLKKSEIPFSERKNFVTSEISCTNQLANCSSTQENLEKHQKSTSRSRNSFYGAYATEKIFQLHNQRRFHHQGRAENVESVFNQTKFYSQFLSETGIKGKLLESIQFGLPVT